MLFKFTDFYKPNKNIRLVHRGIVVYNQDEKKLGRIKVKIPYLLESQDIESLPWIYPDNPAGLGGRVDCSEFHVPEVNSEVCVYFPDEDISFGYYRGYWQNSSHTHQVLFDEDYPESYGKIDSTISWWKVNKKKQYTEHYHVSRHTTIVDKQGNGYEYFPGRNELIIDKDLNIKVLGNVRLQIAGDFILQVLTNFISNITGDWATSVNGATLIKSMMDIWLETMQNFGCLAAMNSGLKSGANMGFVAGGNCCTNASQIHHNGPVVDVQAIFGSGDSAKQASDQANLSAQIAAATALWNQLMQKVNELTTQANQIRSLADSVRSALAQEAASLTGKSFPGSKKGTSHSIEFAKKEPELKKQSVDSYMPTVKDSLNIVNKADNLPVEEIKNDLSDVSNTPVIQKLSDVDASANSLLNTEYPSEDLQSMVSSMGSSGIESFIEPVTSFGNTINDALSSVSSIQYSIEAISNISKGNINVISLLSEYSYQTKNILDNLGIVSKTFNYADTGLSSFIEITDRLNSTYSTIVSGIDSFKNGFDISDLPGSILSLVSEVDYMVSSALNSVSVLNNFTSSVFSGKLDILTAINTLDTTNSNAVTELVNKCKDYANSLTSSVSNTIIPIDTAIDNITNVYDRSSYLIDDISNKFSVYKPSIESALEYNNDIRETIQLLRSCLESLLTLLDKIKSIKDSLENDLLLENLVRALYGLMNTLSKNQSEILFQNINTIINKNSDLKAIVDNLYLVGKTLDGIAREKMQILSSLEEEFGELEPKVELFKYSYEGFNSSLEKAKEVVEDLLNNKTSIASNKDLLVKKSEELSKLKDALVLKSKKVNIYTR